MLQTGLNLVSHFGIPIKVKLTLKVILTVTHRIVLYFLYRTYKIVLTHSASKGNLILNCCHRVFHKIFEIDNGGMESQAFDVKTKNPAIKWYPSNHWKWDLSHLDLMFSSLSYWGMCYLGNPRFSTHWSNILLLLYFLFSRSGTPDFNISIIAKFCVFVKNWGVYFNNQLQKTRYAY